MALDECRDVRVVCSGSPAVPSGIFLGGLALLVVLHHYFQPYDDIKRIFTVDTENFAPTKRR